MYIVRKYHRQIDRFVGAGSGGAFLLAYGLLAAALAALAALVVKLGAPAMNGRPWDTAIILDGAWRIANGQVPHRDYYNYLGDLPFYMTSLGMKMGRPSVASIDYGNLALMAALVLPAMAVLRRRTSGLFAFLFGLFLALLVIAPKPLGDPYDFTDHAMLYNRYGDACLLLFATILFLPPKPGLANVWADRAEAVLAGLAAAALLGCKLNYFAVGLVCFGAAFLLGRIRLGWALLCACSAAAFLTIAFTLSKIPIPDLIHDYRLMLACQSSGSRLRGLVIQGTKNILWLPLLLLPVWEAFLGEAGQSKSRQPVWQHFVVMLVLFGGATLLLSSNNQLGEMPLLALAALCGAEWMQRQANAPGETPFFITARHVGALLLVALFLLPSILSELETFRFVAFNAAQKKWDSPQALQSTRLSDFRFVRLGTRSAEMRNYADELDEGVQLLQRHADPAMRLGTIMFSDPFHVALGWAPATGGIISLTLDGLTKASHPTLTRLLGNATHILTERGCLELKAAYGPEWDALHLEVVEETRTFSLFKIPGDRTGQTDQAQTDSPKH